MSDIGQNIRKIREFRNLTQDYLAEQLGISTRSYGKIESGESDPAISRLNQIAKILEVRVDQLLSLNEKTIFNTFQHQEGHWFVVNNGIFSQERASIEKMITELKEEVSVLRTELSVLKQRMRQEQL